jgi:hypothetical protein
MLNGSMIPRSVRRLFDERSEPREPAGSQVTTLELRGRKHDVRVSNLSASGAMVVFAAVPRIGEQVALHLADRGRVPAQVCWVRDGHIGVNFIDAVK